MSRSLPNINSVSLGLLVAISLKSLSLAGCQAQSTGASDKAGVILATAAPVDPPVSITLAPVTIREVERRVSIVGGLEGFETVTVTPEVEGRVDAILVDVGDRVQPGTLLLQLDPTDQKLAVSEAQRGFELTLSRLDLSQPPADDFDLETLPIVERATLVTSNARRQYDRTKTLLASSAASLESFERTETDLKVAEASLRQARLEARTTLAEARHRQSVLAVAQQKLANTRVVAPQLPPDSPDSGFVVAKRMAAVGEMVRAFPSTPVFELVADDILKLRSMVPERHLAQVVIGQQVEVRSEAYPDEVFPGVVKRISPVIDPSSRSFGVEAHVPNPDHRLRHGGFAKVDIVLSRSESAVTVPLESVTRFAGVAKVFRIKDGVANELEIQPGMQGPGWIEVLGGLAAGDEVATSGQTALSNGSRITVRASAGE